MTKLKKRVESLERSVKEIASVGTDMYKRLNELEVLTRIPGRLSSCYRIPINDAVAAILDHLGLNLEQVQPGAKVVERKEKKDVR